MAQGHYAAGVERPMIPSAARAPVPSAHFNPIFGYLRLSAVDPLDTKQSRQSCVESVLVCRDNLYCALPQPQPRSSPLPGLRRRI
ncbi:hypothetical protein BN1723_012070 [Verticillium longisporum]|uniref:Uncharacterized protein n=1 Tax=Verticillium longisporum TaxID=100787 RepID=A0A0G4KRU4_VERLO|nr:hypothetical protein BN1708_010376 [Verticillium longisporum]CRK20202.1 hypothetical protein BN1723_012070 [Verticillium longisporum]